MSLLHDRLEQRIAALIGACPRTWGWLVEGFTEGRFQAHVGQGGEHRETREGARIPRETFTAAALAARVERNVRAAADLAIESKPERAAALDRPIVAARWPLSVGPAWGETDEDVAARVALDELPAFAEDEGELPADWWVWPATVSASDVASAVARGKTAESSLIAEALRKGFYSPGQGFRFRVGEVVTIDGVERARMLPPSPAERWFREHEGPTHEGLLRWSPVGFAVVLAALDEVRTGALALRGTPLPATRPMRAAMQAISRVGRGGWGGVEYRGERASISLHWPGGRALPHQLTLGFPGDYTEATIAGVLDELQAEGLRDYLLLHRMAAEQGRTGELVWTWADHKARTAYDRRVKARNVRDADVQRAVTARLWRLKSAELRETVAMPGEKTAFRRVGPFGLIDIPAGVGADDTLDRLDAVVIRLNPAIYRGAATGTGRGERHFTLLPDAAFTLDGGALRLAALLVMRMRDARDEGGEVRLTASTLWEYLGARGGDARAIPRKRWPATDKALRRVLGALEGAGVIGTWNRAGGEDVLPGALYRLSPAAAWRDAVVHRVPPALPPSKAAVPWTGEGLRRWRAERGLSQASAAAALGVSPRTILRAEATGGKALGAALVDALARLGR